MATPTTAALVLHATYLDTLFDAHLLCEVCEQAPWTQTGQWHGVRLCCACAASEPHPDED